MISVAWEKSHETLVNLDSILWEFYLLSGVYCLGIPAYMVIQIKSARKSRNNPSQLRGGDFSLPFGFSPSISEVYRVPTFSALWSLRTASFLISIRFTWCGSSKPNQNVSVLDENILILLQLAEETQMFWRPVAGEIWRPNSSVVSSLKVQKVPKNIQYLRCIL